MTRTDPKLGPHEEAADYPFHCWCEGCGTFLPYGGEKCGRCREGKSHPSNMNEDRDNDRSEP